MGHSTIEKGNEFRELVASMLEAAGFKAESEVRQRFKKVDVCWQREEIDGQVRYVIEAKDHDGNLGMSECREFLNDYGTLVETGEAERGWLVSKGPISPDGRAMVDAKPNLKCMTFAEFQR